MALYLVSYDLQKTEKDYPELIAYLKKLGGVKILLSEWLVASSLEALPLLERIQRNGSMDTNDRILVMQVAGDTAWYNLRIEDREMQRVLEKA